MNAASKTYLGLLYISNQILLSILLACYILSLYKGSICPLSFAVHLSVTNASSATWHLSKARVITQSETTHIGPACPGGFFSIANHNIWLSSKLGFLLRFYSVFWKLTMKSESWRNVLLHFDKSHLKNSNLKTMRRNNDAAACLHLPAATICIFLKIYKFPYLK